MTDFPWYPQIDGCPQCGATDPQVCTCSIWDMDIRVCSECYAEAPTLTPELEHPHYATCSKLTPSPTNESETSDG